MRIALIACPAWAHWAPHPALLLLGAQLRTHGFEVDLFDLNIDSYNDCNAKYKDWWLDHNSYLWESAGTFQEFWEANSNSFNEYARMIANTKPDLIGFCINAGSRFCSPLMATLVRSLLPNTPIIVGGPDCFRSEYFTNHMIPGVIDALCPGEGDYAIVNIAKAVEEHGSIPEKMAGFLTWVNREISDNGEPERPRNLDDIAPINLEGIDLQKYVNGNRVSLSISRGCIKRCAFCSEGPNFFKFRSHTAIWMFDQLKSLVQEISLSSPKLPHINFNDSLINGNIKVLEELCDLLIANQLKFTWGGMAIIRPEMTFEFLKKMKTAGCVEICWGIESGSSRVLNLMRKNLAVSLVDEVLRNAHAASIQQYGNIIIGFPGEGPAEFAESLFFAAKNLQYFGSLGLPVFTPTKNSTVQRLPHRFGMASLDSANWTNLDDTNTPEIRSFRRELISYVVGSKKFDQGKFEYLTNILKNNLGSEKLQQELYLISDAFHKFKADYLSQIPDAGIFTAEIDVTENFQNQYIRLLNSLDEFKEFCSKNPKYLPLIPDRVVEGELRPEITRGSFKIITEESDIIDSPDLELPRQWITVKGVTPSENLTPILKELESRKEGLFAKNKISTINSFLSFLEGKNIPENPLEVFVEISNVCNLKCAMCPTFSGLSEHRFIALKAEDRGFFDLNGSLKELEEVLKGTLNVHCFGYGESTIHPEFRQIIEFLGTYDVMLDFFSNGMNLTEEICELLVTNNVANITISFSGTTKEEYENIYLGGIYEQVLSNIRRLADLKELYKSKYPIISINSLAFEHHIRTLDQFIDIMADHGANIIHLKSLQLHDSIPQLAGHKAVMRPWEFEGEILKKATSRAIARGLIFSADQFTNSSVSNQLDWEKEKATTCFGKQNFDGEIIPLSELKNIAKKIKPIQPSDDLEKKNQLSIMEVGSESAEKELIFTPADIESKAYPCMEPFKTMYVRRNGKIKPCCFSPDTAIPMGSLSSNTLGEIWNGAGFEILRNGIINDQISQKHCSTCIQNKFGPKAHFTHELISNYIEWYESRYEIPLLPNPYNKILSLGSNLDALSRHRKTPTINTTESPVRGDSLKSLNRLIEDLNIFVLNDWDCSNLVQGYLEHIEGDWISAWAWSPELPELHLPIALFANDTQFATVLADRHRSDLEAAGIGNGCYSIRVKIPDEIKDSEKYEIRAKIHQTDLELRETPLIYSAKSQGDGLSKNDH